MPKFTIEDVDGDIERRRAKYRPQPLNGQSASSRFRVLMDRVKQRSNRANNIRGGGPNRRA